MRAYYSSENSINRRSTIIALCKGLIAALAVAAITWFVADKLISRENEVLQTIFYVPMNLCLFAAPFALLILLVEIAIFLIYNKGVCHTEVKFPLLWIGIFAVALAVFLFVFAKFILSEDAYQFLYNRQHPMDFEP